MPFTTPVALVAAVKSGQVDAGVGTASLYADVIASGDAHVVLQAGDPEMADVLGTVKYPEGALFGLADVVDKKADDVVKVIAAIDRASAEMKSQDPSVTAATISKTSLYHNTPVDVLTRTSPTTSTSSCRTAGTSPRATGRSPWTSSRTAGC